MTLDTGRPQENKCLVHMGTSCWVCSKFVVTFFYKHTWLCIYAWNADKEQNSPDIIVLLQFGSSPKSSTFRSVYISHLRVTRTIDIIPHPRKWPTKWVTIRMNRISLDGYTSVIMKSTENIFRASRFVILVNTFVTEILFEYMKEWLFQYQSEVSRLNLTPMNKEDKGTLFKLYWKRFVTRWASGTKRVHMFSLSEVRDWNARRCKIARFTIWVQCFWVSPMVLINSVFGHNILKLQWKQGAIDLSNSGALVWESAPSETEFLFRCWQVRWKPGKSKSWIFAQVLYGVGLQGSVSRRLFLQVDNCTQRTNLLVVNEIQMSHPKFYFQWNGNLFLSGRGTCTNKSTRPSAELWPVFPCHDSFQNPGNLM